MLIGRTCSRWMRTWFEYRLLMLVALTTAVRYVIAGFHFVFIVVILRDVLVSWFCIRDANAVSVRGNEQVFWVLEE